MSAKKSSPAGGQEEPDKRDNTYASQLFDPSRSETRKVRCYSCFKEWAVRDEEATKGVRVKCPDPNCGEVNEFQYFETEWKKTAQFEFRGNKKIRRRETGISVFWTTQEKEIENEKETGKKIEVQNEDDIIQGFILPKRKLIVERQFPYFEIELRLDQAEILTGKQIADELKIEGRILNKKLFEDVLNHTLRHFCKEEAEVNATYGIYPRKDGSLFLDESPVGVSDEQRTAFREIKPAIDYKPTKEDFELIPQFNAHFEPEEVLVTMGLSAIAAMAQPIRSHKKMLPHDFNVGPPGTSGLGKSLVHRVYVDIGWGREPISEDALETKFRFAAFIDAYCGPQTIGEAENIDSKTISALLKNSTERWFLDKRGKENLKMVPYNARETFFMDGNLFPITQKARIARFFLKMFHAEKQRERIANKPVVDGIVRQMKPIGPFVARKIVELWPTWTLFEEAAAKLESEISRCYNDTHGLEWQDPRRAEEWSFDYMGLMAWDKAFRDTGVEWQLPTVEEFTRTVVVPVEEMTWRTKRDPLEVFDTWLLDFLSMNVTKAAVSRTTIEHGNYEDPDRDTEYEYISKGEGQTWERGYIEINGVRRAGVYVTGAVLDRFNKEQPVDLRFDSLRSLADAVSRERDVPLVSLLDENGIVERHTFGVSGRKRAVFVPEDISEIRMPELGKKVRVRLKVPLTDLPYDGAKYSGKEGQEVDLPLDLAIDLVRKNSAVYSDAGGVR